jgi:hypothetical protein
MIRHRSWILIILLAGLEVGRTFAQPNESLLVQRQWFVTRTAHFNIYSCGPVPQTYMLAMRLEQFCDAYSLLAGTNAVASPPVWSWHFPTNKP